VTSTRHDGDSWDLASSVGAAATMAATARAIVSRADRSLIDGPFAEPLVRAVGVDLLTRLATGEGSPNAGVRRVSTPTWRGCDISVSATKRLPT